MRLDGKISIPADYEVDLHRAYETFCHQRVYNPETQSLVCLLVAIEGLVLCGESECLLMSIKFIYIFKQ